MCHSCITAAQGGESAGCAARVPVWRAWGSSEVALIFALKRLPGLATVLQARQWHQELWRFMFAFRRGHQHLSLVALLAVPFVLAFVIGSPIPDLHFGLGGTATSHVGPLAEVAATGAWLAWSAGLATEMRRLRSPRPAQVRIKPNRPASSES